VFNFKFFFELELSVMAFLGFVTVSEVLMVNYFVLVYVGDTGSLHQIPMACKDSVAILVMFDLTNRCTLNR